MKLVANDCQKGMYDFVFVNFVREANDSDIDNFAIQITKANAAHKICRVAFEHVGSFQTISKDFFSLYNQKSNFLDLYQNKNEDHIVNQISHNLYEMFCSLGVAPILKTESDDDQINKKIQEKLFELFTNTDD